MTKPVINLDALETYDWGNGGRFEAKLGRIGPAIGAKQLGAMLHIVPPGKAAFPRHNHHANEEMIYVLSGTGTWHAGEDRHPVRAGDMIGAPAGGAETAHQLENTGTEELRYICFSTRIDPEIAEYPDSGKVGVFAGVPETGGYRDAKIVWFGRLGPSLDYWEGDE